MLCVFGSIYENVGSVLRQLLAENFTKQEVQLEFKSRLILKLTEPQLAYLLTSASLLENSFVFLFVGLIIATTLSGCLTCKNFCTEHFFFMLDS